MLAQDTQCVQSLCTGRYDALYVQRYRQTTGKCDCVANVFYVLFIYFNNVLWSHFPQLLQRCIILGYDQSSAHSFSLEDK